MIRLGRFLGCLLAASLFLASGGPAMGRDAVPAALRPSDKADIARIEDYFNRLKTVKARFLQVSSEGTMASGTLYIWRPGRLRFEYAPPVPILIVTSGLLLVYYDKELEQVTHVFLSSTPLAFLLREKVSFSGDMTVTRFVRGPNVLRVTLADTDAAEKGSITLVFSDKPLALRKWIVTDTLGVRTTIILAGVRRGLKLDPELFQFKDPTTDDFPAD